MSYEDIIISTCDFISYRCITKYCGLKMVTAIFPEDLETRMKILLREEEHDGLINARILVGTDGLYILYGEAVKFTINSSN